MQLVKEYSKEDNKSIPVAAVMHSNITARTIILNNILKCRNFKFVKENNSLDC